MKLSKCLFLINILILISYQVEAQRIKPITRIEKAPDSTYILLSDINSNYDHFKLIAGDNISLGISNDSLFISSLAGGSFSSFTIDDFGNNVKTILDGYNIGFDETVGLDISLSGTSDITLSIELDFSELLNLTNPDGADYMVGRTGSSDTQFEASLEDLFTNMLFSSDNSVTISYDNISDRVDLTSSGGGGFSSFNFDVNGGTAETITDGEQIGFNEGTFDGIDISNTGNDIKIIWDAGKLPLDTSPEGDDYIAGWNGFGNGNLFQFDDVFGELIQVGSGLSFVYDATDKHYDLTLSGGGSMNSFNIQEDGNTSENIGDGETINFASGTNMDITRAGNTLTFNATGGGTGTDDQTIDFLNLNGSTLEISLEGDGQPVETLSLSSLLGTDDQTIDTFSLVGNTLRLSLEDDAEAFLSVDLSTLADDQTAAEVSVTATGNLNSTDVQAALQEHQADIDALASGAGDGVITTAAFNGATNEIDVTVAAPGSSFSFDVSPLLDNTDNQDLSLSGTTLSLTGDGTTVSLAGFLDNTDTQDLSWNGSVLSLTNGGSVNLSGLSDGTGTDDQTATEVPVTPVGNLNSSNVQAALQEHQADIDALGGGASDGVAISGSYDSFNEEIDIVVASPGNNFSINVSSLLDNTDTQDLSIAGNTLSLTNSPSVTVDGSPTNELQDFDIAQLSGNNLELSLTNDPTTWVIDLSSLAGGSQLTQEEVQDYVGSMVSGNTELGISVTYDDASNEFDFVASDQSATNELQDFDVASLSGNTLQLSLTNDASVHNIDLSPVQLTQEEVQDYIGSMVSGNTESGISVTYDDAGNEFDFVVSGFDNYSSWTLRADDATTDNITSGETVDIAGGTGVLTTNDLTNLTINLQPTQFTLDNTISSSDYVWTWTSGGTQRRTQINSLPIDVSSTNELQDFDIAQLVGTDLQLSLTQDATTSVIDLSSLAGGSGMTSFFIDEDGGTPEEISDGETIGFNSGGGGLSVSRSGNDLTFTNFYDWDLQVNGGTEVSVNDNTNVNLVAGTNMTITRSGTTVTFDAAGGGGTMDDWSVRGDDGIAQTITDGFILDINGGNGIESDVSLGDVDIQLDGDGLIDGNGISNGGYQVWTFSGVQQYREDFHELLTNSVTSSDGSINVGTSGSNMNLTVNSADAWDDASQYLYASGGTDISSTNFTSTYSDKRNFTVSLNCPNNSTTSDTQLLLPTASSTYQYHRIAVTCSDNETDPGRDCIITNTVNGAYTMTDGEMVTLTASQYESSWAWWVN